MGQKGTGNRKGRPPALDTAFKGYGCQGVSAVCFWVDSLVVEFK